MEIIYSQSDFTSDQFIKHFRYNVDSGAANCVALELGAEGIEPWLMAPHWVIPLSPAGIQREAPRFRFQAHISATFPNHSRILLKYLLLNWSKSPRVVTCVPAHAHSPFTAHKLLLFHLRHFNVHQYAAMCECPSMRKSTKGTNQLFNIARRARVFLFSSLSSRWRFSNVLNISKTSSCLDSTLQLKCEMKGLLWSPGTWMIKFKIS